MKQDFDRVQRGMSMQEVEAILGPPDEAHPTSFGAEQMTTWTYDHDCGRLFVWFDTAGQVKLKSLK
jgi:hypothetical protein